VEGKTFGLMSTLGGQTNSNTLNHLRLVVRWLRAWTVPTQVAVGTVKSAFDEDGELVDEELASRVEKLSQEVVDHAVRMRD
jgi:FMN reductase